MKTVVITLAILVQSVFVFADNRKETYVIKAKYENVKVYRQAGTSAEVVESLKDTDEVTFVREFNKTWSIVQINGKVGYVLTSEIMSEKVAAPAITARVK
jgi:uncharacterized protein YgiM (DUF1202 family)